MRHQVIRKLPILLQYISSIVFTWW